ncbi:lipoyl domain-containing protein [Chryseobacterium cucumeris]|uniref:lipoyl domain-containing protein n=1 Tax=Chryseobacterium cucumeris TaxID=1813611 RepID=UPI003D967EC9
MDHIEIKMSSTGDGMKWIKLKKWFFNDNEMINKGDIIAEVETDLAILEIEAFANGKLEIKKQEEEAIDVGDLICNIKF